MSQSTDPSQPGAGFESSRVFAWLTRPEGEDRPRAVAIAVALLCLTGLADYFSGVRVSLQLFYLAPITVAAARLGRRSAYAVCVASVVVRVAGDYAVDAVFVQERLKTILWNRTADLCVYLVVGEVLCALISFHRRLEERVRERTAELQRALTDRHELQTLLFEVSRRERGAIGHELHDDLGQHLTAASIAADILARKLSTQESEAAAGAQTVVKLVLEAIAKTRQIARGLLLSAIEPGELVAELESLASHLTRDFSVPCRVSASGALPGLDDASASHLYYIAREATLNALKHGRPSGVAIRLSATAESVVLSVEDDGAGLPPEGARGAGMGLRIMEHRTGLIGGSFCIESSPGSGTRVVCTIPLPGNGAAA